MFSRYFTTLIFVVLSSQAFAYKNTIPLKVSDVTDAEGFRTMPLTLGEDYNDGRSTIEKIRKDLQTAKDLGVKYLRFGFSWLAMEDEQGKYNFEPWDKIVTEAARYKIKLIPYVAYTPEWAEGTGDPGTPPRDLNHFGTFMSALVSHYKKLSPGTIESWELWNEPDVDTWRGTPKQFAEMIKIGSQAVREADPDAKVVLGGMTMGPSDHFFEPLLTKYGVGPAIDIFAYHVYPETWWPERIEEVMPNWPNLMMDWIEDYAPHAGLWLNEYGYADYRHSKTKASMWSEKRDVFYDYEHTAEHQAAQFFKIQILNLVSENVTATTWYRIHDYNNAEEINGDGDPVNLHLGVLDVKGQPKPVYHAIKTYQKLLQQVKRVEGIRVAKPAKSQSVAQVFERKNGELIVTAWLRSTTVAEGTKLAGPRAKITDRRNETLTLKLPSEYSKAKVEILNLKGDVVATVQPQAGKIQFTLTGPDFYLARVRK